MLEFGNRKRVQLPELGLGTWRIGGGFTPDHSRDDYYADVIGKALEMGYSMIDTAEMYGSGNAEQIVGKAIRDREPFIATKVSQSNLRYEDVLKAADRSLERLGVSAIDLYQVHWPSDKIPLRDTMRAMEKLAEEGKVRYIGVSNFDAQLLDDARSCLSHEDILTDQVSFSLLDRSPEYELLDYCRTAGVGIIAYEPLARKKVLSGRYGRLLSEIASRYGKTPAQVALNWILCKGGLPIPKSSDPAHLEENLGACGWRLSEKDVRSLDEEMAGDNH